MPELPEVETTRSGILPHIEGQVLASVLVRETKLRYPVPARDLHKLKGSQLERVERRAKYILLHFKQGVVLIHLGMSGSLRIVDGVIKPAKHDHVDIIFENGRCLRYTDPRKFGMILWHQGQVTEHFLLKKLGPEPLDRTFNGRYLFDVSRGRSVAIKVLLMNSQIVVGIGNIYASEALFMAGIDPREPSKSLGVGDCECIVKAAKRVLQQAIKAGGTTLKDFVNGDGKPGYFQQQLLVYGRGGDNCYRCGAEIERFVLGQRSTFSCPRCQQVRR